jgi:hypothetical protein
MPLATLESVKPIISIFLHVFWAKRKLFPTGIVQINFLQAAKPTFPSVKQYAKIAWIGAGNPPNVTSFQGFSPYFGHVQIA